MRPKVHPFALAKNIDSIIAAAIGFFIIELFCRHSGIGVSPDSVTYISASRNFNAGRGLIGFDSMPLVDFPAFYSLFLSAITFITRLDALSFGPILNGLMYAAVIYLSGSIMNGFSLPSKLYKRILLSCFVLSPSLLEIYSMLWSETLFILFVILFFIAIKNYFETHTLPSLLLLSFIVALACVTRYAGVALVGTGGLLLVFDNFFPIRKRIWHLIIFNVISCSLLIINIIRNRMVTGFSTGVRQKGNTSLLQNIYYFGNVLTDWFPAMKNNMAAFILTVGFGIICILAFILLLRKRSSYYSYENAAAAFCIVYSGFMLLSATVSRYEQFTNRLLSPMFIPLLWSLSYWLMGFVKRLTVGRRIVVVSLGILLAACFQYNQLKADYETYDGVKDAGIPGYREDPFPQSDIVVYIQKNKSLFKPGYLIYSNAGDAVYFFTGLSSQLLPQDVFPRDIKNFYLERRQYLVWFNNVDNPDLISLDEILKNKKMKLVEQLNDGAVYESE